MNAYIDLSIIVFMANYCLSLIYSLIIFENFKNNIYFIIQTILLSIISLFTNLFIIPYFFLGFMIIYALFLGLFSIKKLKIIVLSIIIYLINSGALLLIGGCFLFEGLLLISVPYVSFFILIIPIYTTLIHLIASIIYKEIKYHNYKVKCKIKIDDKVLKGKGYYDTGNSLLYKEKPVIFTSLNPISNNGEIIKVSGINQIEYSYLAYKGKLYINKKIIDIYLVFIGKKVNFYNCIFLLNKHVL